MGYPNYLPHAGGKEIKVDHDALNDIAKKLEENLRSLRNKRLSDQITDNTPPEAAMGDYQAGQQMYGTIRAARDQIGGILDEFIQSYEQVIEAIRASNKNHRKADDASKHGVQAAGNPKTVV